MGLILWGKLPDTIATHFDSNGTANGWSSKYFAVFGLPIFIVVCHLVCICSTLADPKKARIANKVFQMVLWICPLVSVFSGSVVYGHALGFRVNIAVAASVLVGIIFIAVGNYLPKCRQNYTIGIKLPWTLYDEDNWNKTHRLGGWLFILSGILMLANIFIRIPNLAIVVLLTVGVVPAVYSYFLYIKKTNGQ